MCIARKYFNWVKAPDRIEDGTDYGGVLVADTKDDRGAGRRSMAGESIGTTNMTLNEKDDGIQAGHRQGGARNNRKGFYGFPSKASWTEKALVSDKKIDLGMKGGAQCYETRSPFLSATVTVARVPELNSTKSCSIPSLKITPLSAM